MRAEDVVGKTEIAARAGVQPDTVKHWGLRHKDFPAPFKVLAMGPVWWLPVVEAWLEQTGRTHNAT